MKRFLFFILFLFSTATAQAVTVFDDGFTEASTIVLSSHTPDTTGTSWIKLVDDASATVNNYSGDYAGISAVISAGQKEIWQANYTSVGADVVIQSSLYLLSTSNINIGCYIARYQDASNYYLLAVSRGATRGIELYKVISGTATSLGSAARSGNTTDTYKFSVIGNTLKAYIAGVEKISVTDSAISSAGKSGIGWGDCALLTTDNVGNSIRFDDLIITETSAGGGLQNQIY